MADNLALYYKLLAAQADAIDELNNILNHLIEVHLQVEELYVQAQGADDSRNRLAMVEHRYNE